MKMKRVTAGLLAVGMLAALTACGKTGEKPSAVTAEYRAETVVMTLTDPNYAGRCVGSDGNALAAQYIADTFRAIGLKPMQTGENGYFQMYEDLCGEPMDAEPQVVLYKADGIKKELVLGVDYVFSQPRTQVKISGALQTDAGQCAEGSGIFFAKNHGEAVSFLRENDKNVVVEEGTLTSIGALMLRADTCGTLLELTSENINLLQEPGAKLQVEMKPSAGKKQTMNVAGVLKGTEGKTAVIVGAHFDGSGAAGELLFPSAIDNASGTAAMMVVARAFAKEQVTLKNDLIFVAFNGEESGRGGSAAFAEAVADQYEYINMINLDCLGIRGSGKHVVSGNSVASPLSRALAEFSGWSALEEANGTSDNVSFHEENMRTAYVFDSKDVDSPLHGKTDGAELLDFSSIDAAAEKVAEFLLQHGDERYDAEGSDAGTSQEQMEKANEALRQGYIQQYGLTYAQAYCGRDAEGNLVLFTGKNDDIELEEFQKIYPKLQLPEAVGEWKLSKVEGICDFVEILRIDSAAASEQAPGCMVNFVGESFEEGKVYTLDFVSESTVSSIALRYTHADGRVLLLQVGMQYQAYPRQPQKLDASAELSGQYAGFSLAPSMDGIAGCYDGISYVSERYYVDAFILAQQPELACFDHAAAVQFIEALRASGYQSILGK